jgi:hypothetical protein
MKVLPHLEAGSPVIWASLCPLLVESFDAFDGKRQNQRDDMPQKLISFAQKILSL